MKYTLSFIALLFPVLTSAANLIAIRDADGSVNRIYFEGNKMHSEMPGNQGYMVLDIDKKTMKVVIHEQRAVMDMSSYLKDSGNTQSAGRYVDTYTKSKGLGPKIIGYETEEYEIYADGKYCGSAFVSVRAVRDLNLQKFARAMEAMTTQIQQRIAGLTPHMDPCNHTDRELSRKIIDIGFPLKSIDERRRPESEVIKISKNARLPAHAFVIPAGYRIVDRQKMMGEAMRQMQQTQPDMNEMMKNLPPEAQEMMRQRMQQMQQMYQQ